MKLKEIIEIKSGKRLPKGKMLVSFKTDHPYIKVKDMTPFKTKLNENFEYLTDDIFSQIRKYTVEENDVILSIVGTIGNVSIIDSSLDGASLTENCVKFLCSDKILKRYLYYFLISEIGQSEIKKGVVGSTQPKLPFYNILNIEIDLPFIEKQQHIVDII